MTADTAATPPAPLGTYGGHAPVVALLATDNPDYSVAVAKSALDGKTLVEIRVRYPNTHVGVKIGDAVQYHLELVSKPLPPSRSV